MADIKLCFLRIWFGDVDSKGVVGSIWASLGICAYIIFLVHAVVVEDLLASLHREYTQLFLRIYFHHIIHNSSVNRANRGN